MTAQSLEGEVMVLGRRGWSLGADAVRGAPFGRGLGATLRHVRFTRLEPADCAYVAASAAEPAGCGPLANLWRTPENSMITPVFAGAVRELHRDRYISDPTWAALDLDPGQRVELCFLVGLVDLVAMGVNTFQAPAGDAVHTPLRTGRSIDNPQWRLPATPRLSRPGIKEIGVRTWVLSRGVGTLNGAGSVDGVELFSRSPEMFWSVVPFLLRLVALRIGRRTGELVTLRATWNVGSHYHWGHHGFAGRLAGLTPDEIARVVDGAADPRWSEEEAAVFSAVDDLHETRAIRPATLSRLRRTYDDGQIAEICLIVGNYEMLCMALNSFGVTFEDGAWYGGPTRFLLAARRS